MVDPLRDAFRGRWEEVGAHNVAILVVQLHTRGVAHSPLLQTRQLKALLNLYKDRKELLKLRNII
jgi:hypothetical protein